MKKTQFFNAQRAIDKFFNTSSEVLADKELDAKEVNFLAAQGQERVRGLFPSYADQLTVSGVYDAEDEFAGYRLQFAGDAAQGQDSYDETFEFDFGEQGIDVVD